MAGNAGTAGFAVALAAVLAGGQGRRMGGLDKAELPLGSAPLIFRVWEGLRGVARRIVVVGGRPYLESAGVPTLADDFPGANSLGGIATALRHAARHRVRWVLCVGCDMPFLSSRLVHLLSGLRRGADLVVPLTEKGHEPLCALYRVSCLPAAERQIAEGDLRVASLFPRVRTREVPESSLRSADPELLSFFNANRPGDLEQAAEILRRHPLLNALRRTGCP